MTNTETPKPAAFFQLRYLLDNAPLYVIDYVAPIWYNHQSAGYDGALASVKSIMVGTRDEALFFTAGEHAAEAYAAQ